jgi:hypothetical protein
MLLRTYQLRDANEVNQGMQGFYSLPYYTYHTGAPICSVLKEEHVGFRKGTWIEEVLAFTKVEKELIQ